MPEKPKKRKESRLVRELFYHLLPIQIASSIVLFLNSLIDSIIVGNFVGTDHLSIITFTTPLTLVISLMGGVVATGAQILAGHRKGEGDERGVASVVSNSVLMCFLFGLAATLICLPLAHPIARLLGAQSGEVAASLADYIRGICLGFIFYVFYKSMLAFLQLDNSAGVALTATATMMISKVLGDLAAVFVFKNGMFGVGFATAVSYFLAAVVGTVYFFSGRSTLRVSAKLFSAAEAVEILHRGIPNAVKDGCAVVRSFAVNRIAVAFAGDEAVTVIGIASQVSEVFFSGINGVGSSTSILASVFAGSRDRASLRDLCGIGLKVGTAINYALFAVAFVLARPFALLFGAEGALADECVVAIRLLMGSSLVNAVTTMVNNVYRSMGYILRVNLLTFLQSICLHIPVCALMPFLIGQAGLYSYFFVGDTIFVIGLILYAARMHGHFPRCAADVVYIPREFGPAPDEQFNRTVESATAVPEAAAAAADFCRTRGDADRAERCAACVAAAANDALNAPDGRRVPSVDFRLFAEDGALTLTVRDNAEKYDPDAAARPSSARIRALAAEQSYHYTLGQNVLTLRF